MLKLKRILSLLLTFVMMSGLVQTSVFSDSDVSKATVYFTVSNKGIIEADNKAGIMANREVIVYDINNDGKLSYDEALVALHKAYNEESGYALDGYGVSRLWGVDTQNTLFFINNKGLTFGVTGDYVFEGDRLVASINADNTYYADWYTYFDVPKMTVKVDKSFVLNLKGHLGMAWNDEDKRDVPIEGASVGLWENGTFKQIEGKVTDSDGNVSLSFDKAGIYYVTAKGTVQDEVDDYSTYPEPNYVSVDCPIIAPVCEINVEQQAIPKSITITHNEDTIDDAILVNNGDKFKLYARDENGNETPVVWTTTSGSDVVVDENTGEVEIKKDFYSSGTSYLNFTAKSTLDEAVSKSVTIKATGYIMSSYQKNQTVTLSVDGQTAKQATVSGGKAGYNIWSWDIPDGIAEPISDPENAGSVKFNVFRPGVFTATYRLSINEAYTDTAEITVKGVSVEDSSGRREKTYLGISSENASPTVQLCAYVEEGRTIKAWSSADENIAVVDENGLVTAKGIGSVIITATDSEGEKGGIKVVCKSEDTPYFENLQFLSTAINNYSTAYKFSPTRTEYNLDIRLCSTTKLTLQNTTLYDTSKYTATAVYTDIDGKSQSVNINSGGITYLDGIPFDDSVVEITLSDKKNEDCNTVYTLNINRPRDTSTTIKTNGLVVEPCERSLLPTKYNGYSEGTMFRLNNDGTLIKSGSTSYAIGVTAGHCPYRCYVFDGFDGFCVKITGNTVYEHIRYSVDGKAYKVLPQGGGLTDVIDFAGKDSVEINIDIIDDKTYSDNIKAGKEGFEDCKPEYTLTVERAASSVENAQILSAATDSGDWYPCLFATDRYSYTIILPNGVTGKTLTYTASDGATVKLGNNQQTAVDGAYTLALLKGNKSLTITSADGMITNTYTFAIQNKLSGYPDKVVDYLCINGQYTNGVGFGNAATPWVSLYGTYTSIGGFGGYITYYYDEPITDNPNNKYGVDFYVYGNANKDTSTPTKTSFFEPSQAWVSEDGEKWYALAGSAHYDDGVIWDYSVTYEKTPDGKTAWTDSLGNSNDGSSYCGAFPSETVYNLNKLVKNDKITLSGIALPARNGKIAVCGEATDAYPVRWGYADCFVNGTKGNDVNPYADNESFDLQTNGFDLKWAVDENGIPIDVSEKKFHYVKLVTASNIWHPSFCEKSSEIAGVLKTTAQSSPVGITNAPDGIKITDGVDTKVVKLTEEQQYYNVDVGNMKYISVSVAGAGEDDNIYVNNTRISHNEAVDGIKITRENGGRLVRIIVQNGDKEPLVYVLKIQGNATESNDIIEGVKLDINGTARTAETKDGKTYASSVGYRIESVGIYPVADSNVNITINGEPIKDKYSLASGKNIFNIAGEIDGESCSVNLIITKDYAPVSDGKITVYFTLFGDEKHGDCDDVHTLKNGGLVEWIPRTAISVDTPATVLDVLEKALGNEHTFINADGNYISEIDGLAEFDNGPLSGWMYTLNGGHPGKGVAEQTVKNGDRIVFHYTDDYTKEQGSEKWSNYKPATNNKLSTEKEDKNSDKKDVVVEEKRVFTENTFSDVKKNDWNYEYVKYVYEKNLMQGTGNGFEPEGKMSRAMLVTVLYRMANPEKNTQSHSFTDVKEGEWYSDAIAWVASNGIVNGISNTEFAPNSDVSREQMALIIYRFARAQGYNVEDKKDISVYTDAGDVSDWALEAVSWANKTELVNGTSEKTLSPKASATRAQVAAILMRFCEKIAK